MIVLKCLLELHFTKMDTFFGETFYSQFDGAYKLTQ